jgi:Holliday junction resolvasome RuvABC endonuclease subunit
MIRCAGIDASTNKTGIAIFEDGKYMTHTLIDLHKIKDASERIPKMMIAICEYLDEHKVDKIIMEESMLTTNASTMKMLSSIAGAVMYYAASHNITFQLDLPSAWRKRIGLTQGKSVKREALKAEAILAVKQEYGMDLSDDESESILICRSGFDLPKIVITEDDLWEI